MRHRKKSIKLITKVAINSSKKCTKLKDKYDCFENLYKYLTEYNGLKTSVPVILSLYNKKDFKNSIYIVL